MPWANGWVFCRGLHNGLPLLSWGCAPKDQLATKRQLRSMGRRPGGAEHVAYLYFRHVRSCKTVFSELYMIEWAKPVRPMTPAKWATVDKMLQARRTCRDCGEVGYAELPKSTRTCEGCRADVEALDPWSWIHDYLEGAATLTGEEHLVLDEQLGAELGELVDVGELAAVIPLQRDREQAQAPGAVREAVSA